MASFKVAVAAAYPFIVISRAIVTRLAQDAAGCRYEHQGW